MQVPLLQIYFLCQCMGSESKIKLNQHCFTKLPLVIIFLLKMSANQLIAFNDFCHVIHILSHSKCVELLE